jgi:hypothetical protein
MTDEAGDPEVTLPADDSRATELLGAAPPLHVLKDLAQLAGHLGRIQERVAADLDETEGSIARGGTMLAAIETALARIERKVDSLSRPRWPDEFEAMLERLSARLGGSGSNSGRSPVELSRTGPLAGGSDAGEPAPVCPEMGPAYGWEQVVLGDALWSDPEIAVDRRLLLEGFLAREPAACALAALLLLFQYSPPARVPPVIKDLGEAFYHWQPQLADGATALEAALANWVVKSCEAIGLGHRVELVRPGSRYDPQRHRSQDRGVEVSRALGWVVLRDDGSVFQKANVAVR